METIIFGEIIQKRRPVNISKMMLTAINQFTATGPKTSLTTLSIPGLWLFGENDIQIPVKLYIEQLNQLKAQGKPFEYTLFSKLGHNTAFDNNTAPFDISIQWIKQKTLSIKEYKILK